ncbi:MAG: isoaspartyl peptidase/L-asparaginase family protein [Saprospiraceae bacterium]
MKKYTLAFIVLTLAIGGLLLTITACNNIETSVSFNEEEKVAYALVIHGGAGTILKENMTPEQEAAYLKTLNDALDIGEEMLKNGSSSLDAIEKVILFMENSPLFNAGKGAVFNHAGKNELDASIMDGKTQNAGAVGGVQTVKNPILAARAVMEKSDHVLLTGAGADEFAKEQGLELVAPDYFYTQRRWDALQKVLKKGNPTGQVASEEDDYKFGTVGAVALDTAGNIAAGTSTGGMTNKRYNRVGDSPIIGAGTYANNNTCGISATGHGEFFIRYAVAYDISARMEYQDISLKQAAKTVINNKLKEKGGTGGVIGLDKYGNVAMPFNTAGMYRGYTKPGERKVAIYKK